MSTRALLLIPSAVLLAAAASAQPTVSLTLESPSNAQSVTAGTPIEWTIKVSVSTTDNAGLALLSVDLAQDAGNPEKFNIPLATAVPVGMGNFSRPAGITNPPESDPVTGYTGMQRGASGALNLVQIGGAQNTFGQALPPEAGMAQSVNVMAAVGHTTQIVAAGSFLAPSTSGTYVFRLQRAVANVLEEVQPAPAISPVIGATIEDLSSAELSFTVDGPALCAGDLNCDGIVDFDDIDPFVAALGCQGGDPNCWDPVCPWLNGDCNDDESVNFDDIDPFVARIGATCP